MEEKKDINETFAEIDVARTQKQMAIAVNSHFTTIANTIQANQIRNELQDIENKIEELRRELRQQRDNYQGMSSQIRQGMNDIFFDNNAIFSLKNLSNQYKIKSETKANFGANGFKTGFNRNVSNDIDSSTDGDYLDLAEAFAYTNKSNAMLNLAKTMKEMQSTAQLEFKTNIEAIEMDLKMLVEKKDTILQKNKENMMHNERALKSLGDILEKQSLSDGLFSLVSSAQGRDESEKEDSEYHSDINQDAFDNMITNEEISDFEEVKSVEDETIQEK